MTRRPVPVDAEARGKLRRWKQQVLQRYERIMGIYRSERFGAPASDFRWKAGKGRARALARLRNLLAEARFERSRMEDPPHALWAVLHPRDALLIADQPNAAPGKLQDCVALDYIAVGALARTGANFDGRCTGFWSCEFQEHAIGRLIQRDPGVDIDAVLFEAHRNALAARIAPLDPAAGLLIAAGNGAFVSTLEASIDKDTGAPLVRLQCRTWLHADQMQERQIPLASTQLVGERFGDSILLPSPLRHLIQWPEGSEAA